MASGSRNKLHLSEESDDDEIAPVYTIPKTQLAALEHPAIIQNIDRGIASFGIQPDFQRILTAGGFQSSVPLYLNYGDPAAGGLTSHNAASHNVLLKVTLPRRTGRKRKRGSDGPWEGDFVDSPSSSPNNGVQSQLNLDDAETLKRKLQDNEDDYKVEAVGLIKQTHRYRSMADFQQKSKPSGFMSNFIDNVIPGEVSKLRQFTMNSQSDQPPDVELIPPPRFTHHAISFNYAYTQNPYVQEVPQAGGGTRFMNVTGAKRSPGYIISHDGVTPMGPRRQPNLDNPRIRAVMVEFDKAMAERPIWTRRALINRLSRVKGSKHISGDLVRKCICYVGYQFKGGPWRDAIVKYGLDPRLDPKYRTYQTFIFRLSRLDMGKTGKTWHTVRSEQSASVKIAPGHDTPENSHIFDGTTVWADGKVWQICDVTDPLLASLFRGADVRPQCDVVATGWYHQGLWAKCKGIMKSKIQAIHFKRDIPDSAYAAAVSAPDMSPVLGGASIPIKLPNLQLTEAESETLSTRKYHSVGSEERRRPYKSSTYFLYAHKKRRKLAAEARASQGREGEEGEGENGEDENGEEEYSEGEYEEDGADGSGSLEHSEMSFAPLPPASQQSLKLIDDEIALESGSGSGGDDSEIEEYEGGEDGGLEDDSFEDDGLEDGVAGNDVADNGPPKKRVRFEGVDESDGSGEDDYDEQEGYYEDEGEGYEDEEEGYYEPEEYGVGGEDAMEGEEFAGDFYEEEGFADQQEE